ncbi:MAG: transglutaminase domain-containing protein [Chlorobi bacterium]|nr:transglutaminase domain-containing protein [Chlorobiota bacterium]
MWFKPKWFFEKYPTSIKFSDLMKIKGGECRDMTNMGLLVMRSIGIPVAKIYSPQDGNRRSGLHSWNIVLDKNGEKVIFQGAIEQPGYDNLNSTEINTKRAKIFQQTYRRKDNNLPSFEDYQNIIS